VRSILFVIVCFAVGLAARIERGNYHPIAIGLIAAAVTAALIAVINPAGISARRLPRAALVWTLLGCCCAQVGYIFSERPVPLGGELDPHAELLTMIGLIGVALGACGCACAALINAKPARLAGIGIAVLLMAHLMAAVSAVRTATPPPPMDVIVFQELAGQQLLDGASPYAMTFPDLSFGTSPHYGPGLQKDGQLLFGFPYPPLSLLAVMPASILAGDFRFAHAIAMTLVGVAIALMRRSAVSGLVAALFLLMPIGPFVLACGWTEPLVALMLAATVWAAMSNPSLSGVPLGLFWAVKQYVPLTAPLMWLLPADATSPGRARGRTLLLALGAGAVVTLPVVLMDLPAFWHSAVQLQLQQPFRPDALSFQSLVYRATGAVPPSWPAFAALAVVQALALWRVPRTAAGFAGATTASLLVFFALSKQAFANYYMLVIAAAALAAACDTPADNPS